MNANALQLLLAGEYLCPVRYPDEFNAINGSVDEAERVNAWLAPIGMRLARIGADGAFFMTPAAYTDKITTRIKGELREFRDTYGPAVRMLDFIRQVRAENALCSPGERLQLADLETTITGRETLSTQLRSLIDIIHNGNARVSDRENLERLMEHLERDGYVLLVDKSSGTYQVTGKIEQLYAALTFLDENKAIEEDLANDQLDLGDIGQQPGAPTQ